MILLESMELIKYKIYLLSKNKQYILKILITRATSTFELVYMDIVYIIFIGINDTTNFIGFTALLSD